MDDLRKQDFPLSDALQELLQQGAARARQLGDAQRELDTLQAGLLQLEHSSAWARSRVKLQERTLSALLCDTEQLQHSVLRLDTHVQRLLLENLELRSRAEEHQETRRSQQTLFSSYRSRVTEHTRDQLQLKQQETSRLQTPVHQTQEEILALKQRIQAARHTVMERRARLENQRHTHTQLRRDIQIQERRCEAVLKRLRSQLKRAQAAQRQLRSDVTHLQTQLHELRSRLDPDGP